MLYADYIKERENKEIVYNEFGFATYRILGDECYIQDIFIKKENRKEGHAKNLADKIAEIASLHGCKYLTGSTVPSMNGSTDSLKAMLAYGFKLLSSEKDFIVLIKEL